MGPLHVEILCLVTKSSFATFELLFSGRIPEALSKNTPSFDSGDANSARLGRRPQSSSFLTNTPGSSEDGTLWNTGLACTLLDNWGGFLIQQVKLKDKTDMTHGPNDASCLRERLPGPSEL